jgi:hypothetical protein
MICLCTYLLTSFFIPPSGWEIAQPKQLSAHVQVGFVGKGAADFRPSINIAFEDTDASLKEYVKAVKKIQTAQPNTQWRDLGKFPMKAGEGRLIEMTNPSSWGEVKILQALFIKDHKAYILTGAVLREEFSKFHGEFLKAFQSLTLTPDLFAPISDPKKKAELLDQFASLNLSTGEEAQKQWDGWQKAVLNAPPELGQYWQFLALKEGRDKIYSPH